MEIIIYCQAHPVLMPQIVMARQQLTLREIYATMIRKRLISVLGLYPITIWESLNIRELLPHYHHCERRRGWWWRQWHLNDDSRQHNDDHICSHNDNHICYSDNDNYGSFSTTTTIETECTLTVEKSFLPLQAGLFARLRRIMIKGRTLNGIEPVR